MTIPCITAEETNGEIKIRSEMELKDMMHQPSDHHVLAVWSIQLQIIM